MNNNSSKNIIDNSCNCDLQNVVKFIIIMISHNVLQTNQKKQEKQSEEKGEEKYNK